MIIPFFCRIVIATWFLSCGIKWARRRRRLKEDEVDIGRCDSCLLLCGCGKAARRSLEDATGAYSPEAPQRIEVGVDDVQFDRGLPKPTHWEDGDLAVPLTVTYDGKTRKVIKVASGETG